MCLLRAAPCTVLSAAGLPRRLPKLVYTQLPPTAGFRPTNHDGGLYHRLRNTDTCIVSSQEQPQTNQNQQAATSSPKSRWAASRGAEPATSIPPPARPGAGISEQHRIARRGARLAGGRFEVSPRFQHEERVETRQPWASRKGGSATARGQRCKRLHPTQPCRRQQEPPQQCGQSRGLLSTAPTPREQRRLQREDVLLQQPLPNRALAAGGVLAWKSVRPCAPHPQRTQHSRRLASSCWSNSML